MTPLLPSISVGTIETRTVIESIRSLIGPRIKFVEAFCVNVDPKQKKIICNSNNEKPIPHSEDVKSVRNDSGASSRVVKDSGTDFLFLFFKTFI
jgi:hypothetical protein